MSDKDIEMWRIDHPYEAVDASLLNFAELLKRSGPVLRRTEQTSGSAVYILALDKERLGTFTLRQMSLDTCVLYIIPSPRLTEEERLLLVKPMRGVMQTFLAAFEKELETFENVPKLEPADIDWESPDLVLSGSSQVPEGARRRGRHRHADDIWAEEQLRQPNADEERIFAQWVTRVTRDKNRKTPVDLRDSFRKNVTDRLKPRE